MLSRMLCTDGVAIEVDRARSDCIGGWIRAGPLSRGLLRRASLGHGRVPGHPVSLLFAGLAITGGTDNGEWDLRDDRFLLSPVEPGTVGIIVRGEFKVRYPVPELPPGTPRPLMVRWFPVVAPEH
jgi:hypothetical protein